VKRYLTLFPEDQVKIWLYEDAVEDAARFYRQVCHFVGVDEFVPDLNSYNPSTTRVGPIKKFIAQNSDMLRFLRIHTPAKIKSVLQKVDGRLSNRRLVMLPATRRHLLESFHDDIIELQKLLPSLDFSRWLED
jgi:hypothetical protein